MKMEKHNEIIRDLCREQLLSLEMFQKGRSRVFLDDNGYYLTVVEFQPSAWGKGSYLNVGLHFLWNTWEHISFDAVAGTCGHVAGAVLCAFGCLYDDEAQAPVTAAVLYDIGIMPCINGILDGTINRRCAHDGIGRWTGTVYPPAKRRKDFHGGLRR